MEDAAAAAAASGTLRRRRQRRGGGSGWIVVMMMSMTTAFVMRNPGCCSWSFRRSAPPFRASVIVGRWGRRPTTTATAQALRRPPAARTDETFRTTITRTMSRSIAGDPPPPSHRGRTFSTFLPTPGGSNAMEVAPNQDAAAPSHRPNNRWASRDFGHSSTDVATHVVVERDQPMALSDLVDQVLELVAASHRRPTSQGAPRESRDNDDDHETTLTGSSLIELGAVWHLRSDGPQSPHLGGKPSRVLEPEFVVRKGDYVRVHHNPRRFPDVHMYDWSARHENLSSSDDDDDDDDNAIAAPSRRRRPGVIVAENQEVGFLVVNKPMRVPVHMTVDNCRENVQRCVKEARRPTRAVSDADRGDNGDDNGDDYVSTPQRLDQNTSGLLVVATSKPFATYFADLLQFKTLQHIEEPTVAAATAAAAAEIAVVASGEKDRVESTSVHKRYRCLVCLSSDLAELGAAASGGQSVLGAVASLRHLAESGRVLRHYLEPSIRSPKRFVREVPPNVTSSGPWQECLLRLRKVGSVCPLVGSEPGHALAEALWPSSRSSSLTRRPENVQAVVELEVELLTGRTHQIRGQLSEAGYPIVGDAPYGGAVSIEGHGDASGDDPLALQCCQLEFVDPDIVQKQDGTMDLKRSNRWNRFRLDDAWWTSRLDRYARDASLLSDALTTTDEADEIGSAGAERRAESSVGMAKPHLLPARVSLSPGRNKYVLIRARHRTDASAEEEWFVKSAAPGECGGPYHGNVAQDVREWIEAAGYEARVTGGGRIYYRPDENCAIVYGFSYAFGRGDHNRAAELIRRTGIYATVDSSPDLY